MVGVFDRQSVLSLNHPQDGCLAGTPSGEIRTVEDCMAFPTYKIRNLPSIVSIVRRPNQKIFMIVRGCPASPFANAFHPLKDLSVD